MDPKIIQQCKAAGGRVDNDKCIFTSPTSYKPKSKLKLNLDLNVGGQNIDIKQALLWTFITTIGFAAIMGILALLGTGWGETQTRVLATTGILGGYGILMLVTFALFASRSKYITYLFSFTLTSSMLLGILNVWETLFHGSVIGKLWGTTGLIFGFGLIAIANFSIKQKQQWLTYLGWVFSGLGFAMVMNLLWEWKLFYCAQTAYNSCSLSENYMKFMVDMIILSVWGGHAALMLLINPKKPMVKNFQWATVGFSALTALIIMAIFHMEPENMISSMRMLGVIGIVNVALTIITPVLNRTR